MAAEKYIFLDEVGVQALSQSILAKVNTRIGERIVTEMSSTVTDTQVLSAKAVKTLLGWSEEETTSVAEKIDDVNEELAKLKTNVSNLTHLEYETFIGTVDELTKKDGGVNLERDPQKIYLQKDNEDDPTWVMYAFLPSAWSEPTEEGEKSVPTAGQWIVVGDTSIDLVNYWSKDAASVAELRDVLKIHDAEALSNATITAAVENAFLMTETLNPNNVAVTYGAGVAAVNYGNEVASGDEVPAGVKVTFKPTGLDAEKEYTYAWTVTVGETETTYTTETVEVTVTAATAVALVATEVAAAE